MKNDTFQVRINFIRVAITLFAVILAAQMIRIQIAGNSLVSPDTHFKKVYPERGSIYDRNGNLMAGNRIVYKMSVNLKIIDTNQNQDDIIKTLYKVLGKDYSEKFLSAQAYNTSETNPDKRISYLPLDNFIEPEEISDLEAYIKEYKQKRQDKKTAKTLPPLDLNGLEWWPHLVRSYPEPSLASNILGFVAFEDQDNPSYYGIEEKYDRLLSGQAQTVEFSDDPVKMKELPDIPAGASFILTIDRQIQKSMEDILDEAVKDTGSLSGVIVVEDPKTGEILAMATNPRMDLNQYKTDLERFPVMGSFNRAIGIPYESGSVFKVLTMAAALDMGTVKPDTVFVDTGIIVVGQSAIHNWNMGAWGSQTMQGCMQHSLNVCLAWIATKMGEEPFYEYLYKFGVGRSTNIDLAGEIVFPLSVPGDTYWTKDSLGTNSFGQGLATTPIQMVAAVSAIANEGKIMAPHVVKAIVQDGWTREIAPQVMSNPISADTAKTLTEMLARSLEEEASSALVENYRCAGKTGTGEIAIPGKGYVTPMTNASFIGWGPADDPQFVVYIWLEEPKKDRWGSTIAAPLFPEIVNKLVIYMNIPPDSIRMGLINQE